MGDEEGKKKRLCLRKIEKLRKALGEETWNSRSSYEETTVTENGVKFTTWDEHPHSGNVSDVETRFGEDIDVRTLERIVRKLTERFLQYKRSEQDRNWLAEIGI